MQARPGSPPPAAKRARGVGVRGKGSDGWARGGAALPEMSQDTLELFPASFQRYAVGRFVEGAGVEGDGERGGGREIATACLMSTLNRAKGLRNPFVEHGAEKTANASESVADLGVGFVVPGDGGARRLKVLLVACSQPRNFAIDFEEIGVAGVGGFSTVVQARSRLDGAVYAVKKNKKPLFSDAARLHALREVFALASLQGHPAILRYHAAWFEAPGEHLFIQTEYLPAGNLADAYVTTERKMPVRELATLAADVASGLAFMHGHGIAHLDIKPDNIYSTNNRGKPNAAYVIADFGLACRLDGADASSTEGDSRYLCPEALDRGNTSRSSLPDPIDSDLEFEPESDAEDQPMLSAPLSATPSQVRLTSLAPADIFSLGATLYELATGVPLEKSGQLWHRLRSETNAVARDVRRACGSSDMANLVRACLAPDPAKRPSAAEVAGMAAELDVDTADAERLRAQVRSLEAELAAANKLLHGLLAGARKGEKPAKEISKSGMDSRSKSRRESATNRSARRGHR